MNRIGPILRANSCLDLHVVPEIGIPIFFFELRRRNAPMVVARVLAERVLSLISDAIN